MKKIIVTGKNGELSKAVAERLKKSKGNTVTQLSVRGNEWKDFDFSSFDTVVHIAGIVPKDGVKEEDFYNINYRLTQELAKISKAKGIKQFIYISSMAVYGITPNTNAKKGSVNTNTKLAPDSDYGKSKLLAENALKELESENFKVTIIRVPSIYGKGKREYFAQYQGLVEKLKAIPVAFRKNYRSVICVDNLCELISMVIEKEYGGTICPDDGKISVYDICKTIYPDKKTSRFLGFILNLLRWSKKVKVYFGSVCYVEELTNVFNGEYRVKSFEEAAKE